MWLGPWCGWGECRDVSFGRSSSAPLSKDLATRAPNIPGSKARSSPLSPQLRICRKLRELNSLSYHLQATSIVVFHYINTLTYSRLLLETIIVYHQFLESRRSNHSIAPSDLSSTTSAKLTTARMPAKRKIAEDAAEAAPARASKRRT